MIKKKLSYADRKAIEAILNLLIDILTTALFFY